MTQNQNSEGTVTLELDYKGGTIQFFEQPNGAIFTDNDKANITRVFNGIYDAKGFTGEKPIKIVSLAPDSLKDIGVYKNGSAVLEILQMYQVLQAGYKALPVDQKEGIDAGKLEFPGFDGNHETKLMAYARFLHNSAQFGGLQYAKDFNSHRPKLRDYQRMLAKWKEADGTTAPSKEQIDSMLVD